MELRKLDSFLGKTEVAPHHGHTIPRLELCATVLEVEIAEIVKSFDETFEIIKFYTDASVL